MGLLFATPNNISYSYYSYVLKNIYFKVKIRGGAIVCNLLRSYPI